MSQTFLEDIPEFLEIQRDSFLRILDTGLIQAFEKINPISPTSQCKYGLLFYPKEYVLILPENTITEAFLQGKTYGCKIYVPAVIYDLENSSTFQKTTFSKKRLKLSKTLKFQKTIGSRFSEEILISFREKSSKVSIENTFQTLSKLSFYKRNTIGIRSSSFFLPFFLGFLKKKANNPIKTVSQKNGNLFDFQSLKNQTSLTPNSFRSSQPIWKWISYVLKTRKNQSSDIVGLETAQKTKKNSQTLGSLSPNPLKSNSKNIDVNYIFPKAIQQKSKLGRVDKAPMWLRGISNHSLIPLALKYSLNLSEGLNVLTVINNNENTHSLAWFLPLSKRSLIIKRKIKLPNLAWSQKEKLVENSLKPTLNSSFKLKKKGSNYARPVSAKEWVCIGVLPLMTPRGHFIINGSHRIIISQMARAPGLYYQTGEKLQATIVPSKGAWLRINAKANDTGEIKVWVRITPQRKIPYKIFIETYKHLENSKSIVNSSSFKFLNLVYKTLNSKIKHLDKHYAIGVISGQITRTLLNSASYSLGEGGRKRLNERIGINEKNGYLTSKDISIIKDHLLKLLGQKSNNSSSDDIDHLKNRRVRTCGELLQVEIETGMTRLKKAIGKQLDDYSNPDSSIFNTANHTLHSSQNGWAEENVQKNIYNSKNCSQNTLAFSSSFNSKTPRFSCFYKNFWNLDFSTNNFSEWAILAQNQNPSGIFFKNKNLLFNLQENLYVTSNLNSKSPLTGSLVYQSNKVGTNLAFARLLNPKSWAQKKMNISRPDGNDPRDLPLKKGFQFPKENVLSPSKIIGTKAFAGALREFFGSNPLSQYMDQTNPLAEMTHKRRLSSLGPGGIDRASAGIAIRGIHPSHYGRICPIETPEGKNAGLVNSMTMWARINGEGFLETPYFKVTGGSVMSHTSRSLTEQWNFLSTKSESEQALKIVSSDLKITQSAFLPSIALPTRDGSERSFGRQKRDYVQFCGVSPMQNISVATSLIPFLEHDDATRALMGSNMQRQAVPLLKATAPLIRTGLEGKVVGESGHALQASSSGIISIATQTRVTIDSFEETQKTRSVYNAHLRPLSNQKEKNYNPSPFSSFFSHSPTFEAFWTRKQKFIGNITLLPFLNEIVSTRSFYILSEKTGLENQEQKTLLQTSFNRKVLPPKVGLYFNDFTKKNYKLACIALSSLPKKKTLLTHLRNLTTVTFPKNLWRKCSKVKRYRKIHDLQQYSRSNQATVCVQKPAVTEGRWVQKGDLIGDCSASKNGVLALGQNIVVAYLPMEGFNFEDAIVVSDRLVHEELYTSIHVQRVEFDMDARVKKYIPRKFKVKKQKSSYKTNNQDWITFFNPHLLQSEKQNLNSLGIIKVGSWVGPGDVLVSKVFPVERKIAPSRHLLAAVFQEKKTKILDTDDTSVRVPKGIHGRVINVKMMGIGKTASGPLLQSCAMESLRQNKSRAKAFSRSCEYIKPLFSKKAIIKTSSEPIHKIYQAFDKNSYTLSELGQFSLEKANNFSKETISAKSNSRVILDNYKELSSSFSSGGQVYLRNIDADSTCLSLEYQARKIKITGSKVQANYFDTNKKQNLIGWDQKNSFHKGMDSSSFGLEKIKNTNKKAFVYLESREQAHNLASKKLPLSITLNDYKSVNKRGPFLIRKILFQELNNNFSLTNKILTEPKLKLEVQNSNYSNNSGASVNQTSSENKRRGYKSQNNSLSEFLPSSTTSSIIDQEYKITGVRIYIAERKKLQVGDKMSGRHGNKGIVSTILPREDMPYLPDGTPVDMVLNPLGIPSRMNVGQVFECLLGLAASICDKSIGHTPFDEMYGSEASRSLVYLFLYVSRLKSRADWLFQPNFPGKTLLFDGRTGTPFEQWVTVGRAYMLKLIHMVDEKIHARSIGPRSLVTQQPVKGRARGGGQRLGEMEIWALEGFGAAYILQEILTIKSDDIKGREDVETSIISATALSSHIPETFRITLFELRCLCLNLELNQNF